MNKETINTWQQGEYIDKREYKHMPEIWKDENRINESLLVRPSTFGNAICKTTYPEDAIWIAERLNFASDIQEKIEGIILEALSPTEKIELIKKYLTPSNH